ncbi:MAG: helicase HerA domain-containing protein [Vicinamibacterales bacterium]
MHDFEKLGLFYLGRTVGDQASGRDLLLYDARDLVTHALIVGMTGSGKTGLGVVLLEEAAIDGIPSIVIDPKGDLANLLLTFPDLQPAHFTLWANPDDARRKGISVEEHGAAQAELWRRGLAEWGQSGDRVRKLRAAADFTVYTPGSEAGIPVSILRSFSAPPRGLLEDAELLKERVATTASSLLRLAGLNSDPIRSREHILLSTILQDAWRNAQDLDLPTLIRFIQNPPVAEVGVMPLETFFPAPDRFSLAMAVNNLLASPAFSSWMHGDPLEPAELLYQKDGRPRVSIFSIAHLADAERMFFVSLLLNQVVGWMRLQPGTTSLRALLYMDEIFGFFPPVANPPSKAPMLTLLKQARSFGLGIVLATQNPVDLDYKGLANAGTWFIGRLQAERDKLRVLDGLDGASSAAGQAFDRQRVEKTLSGLRSRVFLMNNVHEEAPVLFETRWTMSYLRGPLARQEIKQLMAGRQPRAGAAPAAGDATPAAAETSEAFVPRSASATVAAVSPPVLPPEVPQYFAPLRSSAAPVYRPMLLGEAEIRFSNAKLSVEAVRTVTFVTPITTEPIPVDWTRAEAADFPAEDLERAPAAGVTFETLPPSAGKTRAYEDWTRAFATWLYRSQSLELLRSEPHGLVSNPGESERDFRIRLQQAAREQRDAAVERLRRKYAPKVATLQERLRRAEQTVAREAEQVSQQKMQTAISLGATVLGALFGRKKLGASTIGRATTTARGVGRTAREAQDVTRAKETVAAVREQIEDLERRLQEETAEIETSLEAGNAPVETINVKPRKSDITVKLVALTWVAGR